MQLSRGMVIAWPLAGSVDRAMWHPDLKGRYNKQTMVSIKHYHLFIVLYKKKTKKKKNQKHKKKKKKKKNKTKKKKKKKKKKKTKTKKYICIYFSCIVLSGLRCPLHKTPSCKKDQGLPLTSITIECRHFSINKK